jgi:nucleoside-diphosphate-sugar epimerase
MNPKASSGSHVPAGQTVLLFGGTGRTGRLVLEQLLGRGVSVRAIVRSASKLPKAAAIPPRLTVVEADLLSLGNEDLVALVRGCDAVISCLGHIISVRGVFGPPRDLVTRATARLCQAIRDSQPHAPVRYILMSSVSVNHPAGPEPGRGTLDKVLLWVLRGLVPPTRDNQRAADFLHREIGTSNPLVQWVVVRPDTLLEGGVSAYSLHENVVGSLFKPASTNMANVASFMCDLATDAVTWKRWAGRLPVIVNESSPNA